MSTKISSVSPPPKEAEALPLPESPEASDNNGVVNKDALVVFHDASDITLSVNGSSGVTEYKVCSMNLATASDVLRAVIFGKDGQKSVADGNVTLDIGEVDPNALNILLRIAHFDFAKVPRELSLDDLCAVTALTSKYNCTGLVMPWAPNWLGPLADLQNDESCVVFNHKAANIAWELGNAKLLRQMVKNMTASAKLDSDGDLVHATGTKLKDLVLPAGILEEITTIRSETLAKILSSIQEAFDNVTGHTGAVKYCKTGIDSDKCETMMLGSSVSQLLMAGLFPIPQAADGCNLRFKESAQAAIKGMTDPLKEAHVEHLKKQSAVSGVDSHIDDQGDSDDSDAETPAKRTKVTDTISGTGELLERTRSKSPKSTVSSSKNGGS
ncbi:hypothetical protein PG994_002520 [Apiospora phragmitis]|uniref:BTB domain-containing protein n=1 Tax=Apiospora phragmitis TaxID=2905665 RepID=A0ABR1W5I3_9PEZI